MSASQSRQRINKVRSGAAIALLLACLLSGCGNDIEKTKLFEPHTLPDNTIKNARIQRSEQGRLQLIMTAPLVEQYSVPEPKTEYRKGVDMQFYDGYQHPTGKLRARYAISYDKREMMQVRDSVVIIDLQRGDTGKRAAADEQDIARVDRRQRHHGVFAVGADRHLDVSSLADGIYLLTVRTKNGPRVTIGDRFESDDAFESPQIYHQRGTIEWKED